MAEKMGILGAGGQANELAAFASDKEIAFYALNEAYMDKDNSAHIDIANPTEEARLTRVIAAIGAPAIRRAMIEQWPGDEYSTIVADGAYVHASSEIGEGTLIAPGVVVTTNTVIGRHSIVNICSSVSHDCRLGDYVTISPGARVAGNVRLGDGVFVGIGAVINNNVTIASGVVVGAGAVVVKDIETPNSVVVGCPAKEIRINEGWMHEV